MSQELLFFAVAVLLVIGLASFLMNRKIAGLSRSRVDPGLTEWLKSMQASLDTTSRTLNQALTSGNKNLTDTLQKNTDELNRRLDTAARLMAQIQRDAGQFAELSLSMKGLQDYLRSPKLRGNIGEQVLKDLIAQLFPKNSFHLQYTFKSGCKVDAAIKTDGGILPIDSKFPSENFQKMLAATTEAAKAAARKDFVRDVKKHITDIAQKYILPEEGTLDFALMYLPSEPVYYEVANDVTLTEFARLSRVYPVSPNTLYAHLQVILLSFQGREIETRSREIFALLRGVQKDHAKLGETLSVLGRHITNSYNQMSSVNTHFLQIGQKLASTRSLEASSGATSKPTKSSDLPI